MAIALAILDYLNTKCIGKFKLKWPNDIYFENKKLGGILIQNHIIGNQIKSSIIGIGLNINQKEFSAEIQNPISLTIITDLFYDIKSEMELLWTFINQRYNDIKDKTHHISILRNYNINLHSLNQKVKIHYYDNTIIIGYVQGADLLGRLNIKDEMGNQLVIEHGTCHIEYLI
jgi:BirA family biotin operon repressor/biotin-[acetyl-CoA-carboxylase] ligase